MSYNLYKSLQINQPVPTKRGLFFGSFVTTNSSHLQAFRPAKISHPVAGALSQVAEEDAWPSLERMENDGKQIMSERNEDDDDDDDDDDEDDDKQTR